MAQPQKVITEVFAPFQEYMNAEQDVREVIRNIMKDIEKSVREIVIALQVIHSEINCEYIHQALIKAREQLEVVQKGFAALDKVVPPGQYYRYNDHWRFATQRLCFLAALIVFLEKGFLVDRVTAAQMIGG